MTTKTTITDPDGKTTTIVEKHRGCGWWLSVFILVWIVAAIFIQATLWVQVLTVVVISILGLLAWMGRK